MQNPFAAEYAAALRQARTRKEVAPLQTALRQGKVIVFADHIPLVYQNASWRQLKLWLVRYLPTFTRLYFRYFYY